MDSSGSDSPENKPVIHAKAYAANSTLSPSNPFSIVRPDLISAQQLKGAPGSPQLQAAPSTPQPILARQPQGAPRFPVDPRLVGAPRLQGAQHSQAATQLVHTRQPKVTEQPILARQLQGAFRFPVDPRLMGAPRLQGAQHSQVAPQLIYTRQPQVAEQPIFARQIQGAPSTLGLATAHEIINLHRIQDTGEHIVRNSPTSETIKKIPKDPSTGFSVFNASNIIKLEPDVPCKPPANPSDLLEYCKTVKLSKSYDVPDKNIAGESSKNISGESSKNILRESADNTKACGNENFSPNSD